jgi:hypothetical protein
MRKVWADTQSVYKDCERYQSLFGSLRFVIYTPQYTRMFQFEKQAKHLHKLRSGKPCTGSDPHYDGSRHFACNTQEGNVCWRHSSIPRVLVAVSDFQKHVTSTRPSTDILHYKQEAICH